MHYRKSVERRAARNATVLGGTDEEGSDEAREEPLMLRASELMTRPAVTCHMDERLDGAAQKMWDHDCGSLPVVDGEGKVVGMVTDRDICMGAWSQGQPLAAIPVRNVMSKRVCSCRPEATEREVHGLMMEQRIRRVPVVDETSRPLGVVSLTDLAHVACDPRNRNTSADRDFAATSAAIGTPHALHAASSSPRTGRSAMATT
jgi:CBS domain-containing protein